jgi:hypothetical protein
MEDVVCVCLGCNSLLLLAQYRNNQYKLGRPLFIHGFHDAIAFLGLMEKSCEGVLVNDDDGSRRVCLCNIETEKETVHDPRLGDLPHKWKWVRTDGDPDICEWFENSTTGEQVNSNPRMLPDALRERSVALETFERV